MNNVQVRPLLSRCRDSGVELRAIKAQQKALSRSPFSGMETCEVYKRLMQTEEALYDDLAEMEALICAIPNPKTRTILRYYYGMRYSDVDISLELDCSMETIVKARHAAVRWLERHVAEG